MISANIELSRIFSVNLRESKITVADTICSPVPIRPLGFLHSIYDFVRLDSSCFLVDKSAISFHSSAFIRTLPTTYSPSNRVSLSGSQLYYEVPLVGSGSEGFIYQVSFDIKIV